MHVYAHPSKVVNNLQHPKEREKVRFVLSPIFFFYSYSTISSMLQSDGSATECNSCPQSILVQGTTVAVSLRYLPPVSCLFTYLPVPPPTHWPAAYPLVVLTYFMPTDLSTYPPSHPLDWPVNSNLSNFWDNIVFLSGEKAEVSTYLLVCQPVHLPPDLLTCLPIWGQGCLPFYTNQSGGNLVHHCKVYKI